MILIIVGACFVYTLIAAAAQAVLNIYHDDSPASEMPNGLISAFWPLALVFYPIIYLMSAFSYSLERFLRNRIEKK